MVTQTVEPQAAAKQVKLEELIGTRWILIAGVVTCFIGVAFFLKYAYDQGLIGQFGRVMMATAAGIACLIAGEVTRRRGYELVAKGVTALGFGILYATTFFACRWAHPQLLGVKTAFGIAILLTAGAMTYAVVLDEVWIAVLSLLGGFLTPVLLSTGENVPNVLFGYTLILGVGACVCASLRKWRAINALCFVGTWVLYAGWFAEYYDAGQMTVAIAWLSVFFAVYLTMPLLYGLVNRKVAWREDVLLVAANATIVCGYLARMLYSDYRTSLAFAAVVLAAAHAVMAVVASERNREDRELRLTLLTITTVFVTMAIPLYFRMNAVALAWAAEAVVLAFIGLRYASLWTQGMAAVTMCLALWKLVMLPGHDEVFTPVFNPIFGTWAFTVLALVACHMFYRLESKLAGELRQTASQCYYAAAVAILILGAYFEWHAIFAMNLNCAASLNEVAGAAIILAAGFVLAVWQPIRPIGMLVDLLGTCFVIGGLAYAVAESCHTAVNWPAIVWAWVGVAAVFNGLRSGSQWTQWLGAASMAPAVVSLLAALPMHDVTFMPILNGPFVSWALVVAALAACHITYRFANRLPSEDFLLLNQAFYCAALVLMTVAAGLEWAAYCDKFVATDADAWVGRGLLVILGMALVLASLRPVRPTGAICTTLACLIAAAGSLLAVMWFGHYHTDIFTIFANGGFAAATLFLAALVLAAVLLVRMPKDVDTGAAMTGRSLGVWAVVLAWLLITMEIYYYWHGKGRTDIGQNWEFLMQMSISVFWAVYAAVMTLVGFWRNIALIRYMALGLFGLLLGKVFIVDMSSVKNVYRMGAFLATGVVLVGVSYLYQFLKKQGFFEVKDRAGGQ